MKQSDFDAALATLGLVLVAFLALVLWAHLSAWLLAIPLSILVIGIVASTLSRRS